MTFVKRFKSGRISHYLRPVKIITGKYGIETRGFKDSRFICNINFPFFDTEEQAEEYLSIVFKEKAPEII